jgi:hypothetical protein
MSSGLPRKAHGESDVDEQLRRLATQRGSAGSRIVRDWIIEKLREVRISPGKITLPPVAD